MLHDELPPLFRPIQLCKTAPVEGVSFSGKLILSELDNLSEELKNQPLAEVWFAFTFSLDAQGYCRVEGKLKLDASLVCQRCLQTMPQAIEALILVSPVFSDEEAKRLPQCYEPLLVSNEGEIRLTEWIAEELHLALPFVVCHDTQCVSQESFSI